jgi:tetratricopeptide (TPR) repeat protein
MSKRLWAIVICLLLLAAPSLGMASAKKITIALEWQDLNGKAGQKVFGTVDLAEIARRGLYIAFQKEKDQNFPGTSLGGNYVLAKTPIEQMTSLELVVTFSGSAGPLTQRSILFSKTRPYGSKTAATENVYHFLVMDNFVASKDLPASLDAKEVPQKRWADAFWRTHRLAMNYAVQSDEKTKEYEKAFQVKARYDLPRLILVAEEWLDIPEEVQEQQKKEGGGGLFGGKLDEIGDEIAGEKKVVAKKIPTYSIDVLLDEISAEGKYPIAFQSARSVWNDMLEGEVIYQATGGNRRVVTAAIVFSQMQKNNAAKKSDNRILTVDAQHTGVLDQCKQLWPSVKKEITDFLTKNPDWKVIIPQKPVTFYRGDQPAYAMYAWYQVHPESGRMKGLLPNGTRGAFSDELAQLEKTLIEKTKDKVGSSPSGQPVKAFFSQVAGMYVAAAGVLDGVNLTICNPALANLSDAEWRKFLSFHALDFCQKFLEDNSDLYDSYTAQIGFWQGAMLITSNLGGIEAARECAKKALESAANKAIDDAKAAAQKKIKEWEKAGKKEARKAFDEVMEEYAPRLKKAIEDLEKAKEYVDQGKGFVDKGKEAVDRYNKAMADLEQELKQRGVL